MCSAYDRAAIKFRGVEADINFNIEDYEEDLKQVNRKQKSWIYMNLILYNVLCIYFILFLFGLDAFV